MEIILNSLRDEQTSGLSVLGGDPLEKKNIKGVLLLCHKIKSEFPSKTIWLWTGRIHEDVKKDEMLSQILQVIDVLVDGPFVEHLKDESLKYCGSSNQRVIKLSNY